LTPFFKIAQSEISPSRVQITHPPDSSTNSLNSPSACNCIYLLPFLCSSSPQPSSPDHNLFKSRHLLNPRGPSSQFTSHRKPLRSSSHVWIIGFYQHFHLSTGQHGSFRFSRGKTMWVFIFTLGAPCIVADRCISNQTLL